MNKSYGGVVQLVVAMGMRTFLISASLSCQTSSFPSGGLWTTIKDMPCCCCSTLFIFYLNKKAKEQERESERVQRHEVVKWLVGWLGEEEKER